MIGEWNFQFCLSLDSQYSIFIYTPFSCFRIVFYIPTGRIIHIQQMQIGHLFRSKIKNKYSQNSTYFYVIWTAREFHFRFVWSTRHYCFSLPVANLILQFFFDEWKNPLFRAQHVHKTFCSFHVSREVAHAQSRTCISVSLVFHSSKRLKILQLMLLLQFFELGESVILAYSTAISSSENVCVKITCFHCTTNSCRRRK